jgi:hypothetical protein
VVGSVTDMVVSRLEPSDHGASSQKRSENTLSRRSSYGLDGDFLSGCTSRTVEIGLEVIKGS